MANGKEGCVSCVVGCDGHCRKRRRAEAATRRETGDTRETEHEFEQETKERSEGENA
jgi:hypothetical protein